MREIFEEATVNFVVFNVEDIITTSGQDLPDQDLEV